MESLLATILEDCRPYISRGKVATYIPELAKADIDRFGICVMDTQCHTHWAGDACTPFTMQSVVKPLILLMALMDNGAEAVRALVGVESTGKPFDAFNYSDQALNQAHINPMINTGAIALCSLIRGDSYGEKFSRLLELTRIVCADPHMAVDEAVYRSEKRTGSKNRALAYMLKAYGMLCDDVEEVLDCYFRACSIRATTKNLARMACVLAAGGEDPFTGCRLFEKEYARYVNAVLMTCGMYDGSGEFALNVGVPAKSGVGGGIMAVVPGKMGIGIYSPALDSKGNSVAGIMALERLSRALDLTIF